jgi:hypothetical protein
MIATISSRHCEEQSDEAIHAFTWASMDCFAALAMTENTNYHCHSGARAARLAPPLRTSGSVRVPRIVRNDNNN